MNEQLLMAAAVAADTNDTMAQGAMYDFLMERGQKPLTARRLVNEVVRHTRLHQWRTKVDAKSKLRTLIRTAAGYRSNNSIPITVVDGGDAPKVTGAEAYHTFKNGGACRFPGAARRAGYRTEYHKQTLEITVGWQWVAKQAK